MIIVHEIIMPILCWAFSFAGLDEVSDVLEAHIARNRGWPLAEALSPTNHEKLCPANNHMVLEADPSPVEPQMRAQPQPTP